MLGNNQQGELGNAVASSSRLSASTRHHHRGKRRAMSPPAVAARPDPFAEARRATLEQRRRHQKIARLFAATTGPNGARIPEQSMSFSTITLSHGHVAQKSYGPEKRCVEGRDRFRHRADMPRLPRLSASSRRPPWSA